jgi:integrase
MTGSDPAGQKPSKTSRRSLTGSGIVFPTTFASASSRWRLISQNSAHASWLLACAGVRLAEISGLKVQDVDTQEMTINIRFNATRRLKNNQSVRTVPVVDERAIEALRVRVAGKRLTDAVFPHTGEKEGRTVRRPRSANG